MLHTNIKYTRNTRLLKCRLSIKKIILSSTVTNSRNSSAELKLVELGVGLPWNPWVDPLRVVSVTAHHNCLAVAYRHFVAIYKLKVFILSFIFPN